jgi:hypothetical protein
VAAGAVVAAGALVGAAVGTSVVAAVPAQAESAKTSTFSRTNRAKIFLYIIFSYPKILVMYGLAGFNSKKP